MSTGMDQDITKIHNEINQAVNHRFLLTAAAITALALLGRFMFPSVSFTLEEIYKTSPFYLAYVFVLYLLYVQSIHLRKMIRTYSTYLIAKGWSTWEMDWKCARYHGSEQLKNIAKHDVRAHGSISVSYTHLTLPTTPYV